MFGSNFSEKVQDVLTQMAHLHIKALDAKVDGKVVTLTGDTLSAIAKTYYGKASAYPKIFDANRDILKDPDHIYPGQKLKIP